MSDRGWQPKDRVRLMLPDPALRAGRGCKSRWYTGTVREVDPPGRRPGVIVDLDESGVEGIDYCFATHAELEAAPVSPGSPVEGK